MSNMSSENNNPDNEPAAAAEPQPDAEVAPTTSLAAASNNASDSDSDSSDSDATPKSTTEWLATTREKRSTAGNRMKSMLAQEEPDSDMELLFAEDEDDQGFSDAGGDASDVHMDSSSDDEDENNAAADDFEGEKELERQAKERKAAQRKRKAQDAIPAKFRKKVRINPTASPAASTPTSTGTPTAGPAAHAPRPKKKSERSSWLPTTADMPTRASSRSTTRLSKEQLHAQMEEREARRLKQLEQMQKKQARLEALKKPPMTQEERLQEAELVEKRNSKSLNRWEEAEKQREEERRAKLAALNERTLKGPVITFWSGTRQWKDGGAAKYVVMEEKPKRKERKPRDKDKNKEKDKDKDKAAGIEGSEAKPPQEAGTASAEAPNGTSDARFVLKEEAPVNPEKVPQPPVEEQTNQEPKETPTKPSEETPQEVSQQTPPEPAKEPSQEPPPKSAQPEAIPPDATAQSEQKPDPSPSQPEPPAEAVDAQGDQPMSDAPPVMAMPPMPPPPPAPASSTTAPSSGLAAPTQAPDTNIESPPGESETKPPSVLAAPVLAPPAGVDAERTTSPAPKAQEPPISNVLAPPNTSPDSQPPAVPKDEPSAPAPINTQAEDALKDTNDTEKVDGATPAEGEAPPAADTTSTRNTIVYQNFDENAIKDKTIQTQILFGRKMNKLPKPSPAPLCVITNHPARYRDPTTGLPFYNTQAYREIQRLQKGEHRWSKILGAWAGSGANAAKGVPARFLNPDAPGPVRPPPQQQQPQQVEGNVNKGSDGKTNPTTATAATSTTGNTGEANKENSEIKQGDATKEGNASKAPNESVGQPVSGELTQGERVTGVVAQETAEKPAEVKA